MLFSCEELTKSKTGGIMKNDNEITDWMTVKGNHIPIRKGQTREAAMLAFLSEADDNEPFKEKSKPQKPEKVYGFANKERKNTAHHQKHMKDMGFKNQDEYEKEAVFYWEKGEGTIYRGKRRGDFAKYNPKTQRYVVVSADGNIKTFYQMSSKKFEEKKKQEGYEKWIK